jgi:hypothetical protein
MSSDRLSGAHKALSEISDDDPPTLVVVLAFACAAVGLVIATIAMTADNTHFLIAGMALGALGPSLIRLVWPG